MRFPMAFCDIPSPFSLSESASLGTSVLAMWDRSAHGLVPVQVFGAVKTFDLKENGGAVTVTKENRQEYVDLYAQWVLVESVKGQYEPFER